MVRGWVNVPTFPDNHLLCPVRSLRNELARTDMLCNADEGKLFVGLIKLHKAVTAYTLARWLKDLLSDAGINTSVFGQHCTWSTSASFQRIQRAATVTYSWPSFGYIGVSYRNN